MALLDYERSEVTCSLTGYSGRSTSAVVELVTFSPTQRMRRAWLGLVTWWAVAGACILIPVAHFFLVPGFLAFGIYSFTQRSRTSVVALSASGLCPDCDAEQEYDIPERWVESQDVACGSCRRSLKLRAE
jgi:hypothetical protein